VIQAQTFVSGLPLFGAFQGFGSSYGISELLIARIPSTGISSSTLGAYASATLFRVSRFFAPGLVGSTDLAAASTHIRPAVLREDRHAERPSIALKEHVSL